jgi:hypothetical protein
MNMNYANVSKYECGRQNHKEHMWKISTLNKIIKINFFIFGFPAVTFESLQDNIKWC